MMAGSGFATPANMLSTMIATLGSGPGPTWQMPNSFIEGSADPSLLETIARGSPVAANR